MSKELITFQFGHYANFIGTHFWNLQESSFVFNPLDQKYKNEINNDILYREGVNLQKETTYTPRLVVVDLKNSLHTLRKEGQLYEVQGKELDHLWSHDVSLHKLQDPYTKNDFLKDLDPDETTSQLTSKSDEKDKDTKVEAVKAIPTQKSVFGPKYYDLDSSVSVWSDFLKPFFHPKTVAIVEDYQYGSGFQQFDIYGYGKQVYEKMRDELENKSHTFLEECDSLQGLQLLVDTYDAFGGLSAAMLQDIYDDYGSKSITVYSVSPPVFTADTIGQQLKRTLNAFLSYDSLVSCSSMLVPLSVSTQLWKKPGSPQHFRYLNYKADLLYHTSAILASSLQCSTAPYRLHQQPYLMSHVTDGLTQLGRKVAALYTDFPMRFEADRALLDYLLYHKDEPPWRSLTAMCDGYGSAHAQFVSVQGVNKAKRVALPDPTLPPQLNSCNSINELLEIYLEQSCGTSLNAVSCIEQPLLTGAPYPHIFDPCISKKGFTTTSARPPLTGVEEVCIMTSLQSTPTVYKHLENLISECKEINIKKCQRYVDNGLEEDSFRESIENMRTLLNCYDDYCE